ncbi:DNRLRE domain-containing protein [Planctomycetota bacterium]
MKSITKQRASFVLLAILLIQCAQYAHADLVSLDVLDGRRFFKGAPNVGDPGSLSVYHPETYIEHRSVILFNLDSIPTGATINSAELSLVTTFGIHRPWQQLGGDHTTVHAVTKAWIPAEATWNSAATGDPWSSPGVDFSSAVATNSDDVVGGGHTLTWNITSLVSEWIDGSRENYGVLLKSSLATTLHFYTPADPTHGPKLEVDYDLVTNEAPVANAGENQTVAVGDTVYLDGSDSYDPEGKAFTYAWSFGSVPVGSVMPLIDDDTATPNFYADVDGIFVIDLVVNDGVYDSDVDSVSIVVLLPEDVAEDILEDTGDTIAVIDPENFNNPNNAAALVNKLNTALDKIGKGQYKAAYQQLVNDILPKTDGCANGGVPDNNDWIIDCEAQALVYPQVTRAIDLLERLI